MMPMKGPQGTPAPPLVAYCERHLPPDQAAAREASLEAEAEEEGEEEGGVGALFYAAHMSLSSMFSSTHQVQVCPRVRQDVQARHPPRSRHRRRPRPRRHREDPAPSS